MSDYTLMLAVISAVPVTITGTLIPATDGKDIQNTIMLILKIFTIILFISLFTWLIMQTVNLMTYDVIETMRRFCLVLLDRIKAIW